MFAKKKMSAVGPEQGEGRSTAADSVGSSRKVYQKHSRRGTGEREGPRWDRFLIEKFTRSAREATDRNLLYQMTNLQYGFSTGFTVAVGEACRMSQCGEFLNNYYILSKHQEAGRGGVFIENALVEAVQRRSSFDFRSRPVMHYATHIYRIMKQHMVRRAAYLRKVSSPRTMSSIGKEPLIWVKELPTLVCSRYKEEGEGRRGEEQKRRMNTSQSFELKNLAECIREMFQKQGKGEHKRDEEWSEQRATGESWLKGRLSDERPMMECDFSSIEINAHYDLMIDSRMRQRVEYNFEAEQNYGLGELKRRYEEQRLSKINQMNGSEVKKGFGHKRNPTEALHTKGEQLYNDPMTPKQSSSKSVFNSTKNIMMNSPRHKDKLKKSRSKNKDFGVNEAYLLKFDKKKQDKKQLPTRVTQTLKQNVSKQPKSKSRSDMKSKSKSKDKVWRLGVAKNDMRKL